MALNLKGFNNSFLSKSKYRGLMSVGILLGMGALGWNLAIASTSASEATVCDATSSSSVKVTGIKTTYTAAYLAWSEKRTNGDRFFCYGTSPQGTCPNKVASRNSPRLITMTGLTPRTKYYFKFHANYKGKSMLEVTTGSFMTDSSACGATVNGGPAEVRGVVLTAGGDSLEGVTINISKSKGGTSIHSDVSSENGDYVLNVSEAGKYFLSYSYPPFNTPLPESVTVAAGATVQAKTVKMTGAYQAGGTILMKQTSGTTTQVEGAAVKIFLTSDTTKFYTYKTNAEGHYNFGLKPGAYTLIANLNGKNFSTPKSVLIADTDIKVPDILLNAVGVAIRKGKVSLQQFNSIPGVADFKVNGARLGKKTPSTKEIQVYQAPK